MFHFIIAYAAVLFVMGCLILLQKSPGAKKTGQDTLDKIPDDLYKKARRLEELKESGLCVISTAKKYANLPFYIAGIAAAGIVFYCYLPEYLAFMFPKDLLPFNTAIISYQYQGAKKGTETVYIDAVANKIAQKKSITTTIDNESATTQELIIFDGRMLYAMDLERGTGIKVKIKGGLVSTLFGEARCKEYFIKEGPFLEKSCRLYNINSRKIRYFWNGILLKEESALPILSVNYKKEAEKIELNVPLPPDIFQIPPKINITPGRVSQKRVLDYLLGE